MKSIKAVCYILLLYSSTAFSQKRTDSAILSKETLPDGSYSVVFIDTGKHSRYRDEIRQLNIDTVQYKQQVQELRDSLGVRIMRHRVPTMPKVWHTLYLYKNKYYLYRPSDPGTSPWLKITDSTLVELYFDPGIVTSLVAGVETSKDKVQLWFSNMTDRAASLVIHYVDPVRGVAIIERNYGPSEIRYTLMVSEDKLHLYPIIVNYSKDGRIEEWTFDKPDYLKLLHQKSGNK